MVGSCPLACQPWNVRNIATLPLSRSSQSLTIRLLLRLEDCSFPQWLSATECKRMYKITPETQCCFVGSKTPNKMTQTVQNGGCRIIYYNIKYFSNNTVSHLPGSLLLCLLPTLLGWYANFLAFPEEKTRHNPCARILVQSAIIAWFAWR